MWFDPGVVKQFDQRGQVRTIGRNADHRLAAIAVQRLHHQIAGVTGMERANVLNPARNQGWRHVVRKIKHEDLFGRIAHRCRIVDHQRLPLKPFKQMGGGDIAEVERRILPHQDNINVLGQIDAAIVLHSKVIALDPLHCNRRSPSGKPSAFVSERFHIVVQSCVTALLRSFDQGKT